MKKSFLIVFLIVISIPSYAIKTNRCSALFDIHLGYNAFNNIIDLSLGTKPNLRKARTIYNNFPDGNEALRQTGLFIIENVQKDNHPPIESLLNENTNENGLFLSQLIFRSKSLGTIEYRKFYKKLAAVPEYREFYYRTFIWGYPMRWDRNSINEDFETNATDFIADYDAYLKSTKPLTKSEALLYQLFKLEIEFEMNKNEAAFLKALDALVIENSSFFSILNYQQYIKEYFPQHTIPAPLAVVKKDSFDKDDGHPIYASIRTDYPSLQEAVKELMVNPFDSYLENYKNVKKLLPKSSFAEILKISNQLDTLAAANKQKCYLSSVTQNFINNVIISNDSRFSKAQKETLQCELFKKWVNSHIACQNTKVFYMDESLVTKWNALSKTNQQMLNQHFTKVLEESGNQKYLAELQKKLRVKS